MKLLLILFFLLTSVEGYAKGRLPLESRTLDKRYLIDNHLVVSSYRCYKESDGIYASFYDRYTYKELASLRILGCDGEYQDNISDVFKRNGMYVLKISYRYESNDRDYIVTINPETLKIEKRLNKNSNEISNYIKKNESPIKSFNSEVSNYAVKSWKNNEYTLIKSDGSEKNFNLHEDQRIHDFYFIGLTKVVLKTKTTDHKLRFILIDLENNKKTNLFEGAIIGKVGNSIKNIYTYSNHLIVDDYLIFSQNRDLLSINLNSFEVNRFEEFQVGGFIDNGNGVDNNKITHLLKDEEKSRILSFCFNGDCNAFIDYDFIRQHSPNKALKKDAASGAL